MKKKSCISSYMKLYETEQTAVSFISRASTSPMTIATVHSVHLPLSIIFFRNFSRYVLRFSADLHKDEPEIPDSFAIIVPFPGNCNRGNHDQTQQIFKTVLAIILPHQYNILLWVKSLLPRLTTVNPQKK